MFDLERAAAAARRGGAARGLLWLGMTMAVCASSLLAGSGAGAQQRPSVGGETRVLLIGIDAYRFVPQLRGAAADARDLESALRRIGARDVTLLIDSQADRAASLRAFEALLARTKAGDLVFLAVAGHGAQEPERVKGSEPDGMDAVFLLPGFDPANPARNSEKILHTEFNHYIKAFENKGARVVFVADACSGGGLAREVDPRAAQMIYRSVHYAPIKDRLTPVATRADAMLAPIDFERSIFLAAVDKQSKVPEINIPGAGFRGALSYAIARGLEGAADLDHDGQITTAEIIAYVRQLAYQLSDERQRIVAAHPEGLDPKKDVLAQIDRGVGVQPADAPSADDEGPLSFTPVPKSAPPAAAPPRPLASAPRMRIKEPIRLALRNAGAERPQGFEAQYPVEIVGLDARPDLIWDALTGEIISGGDVIAHNIDAADLSGAIDRTGALRWLKSRVGAGPQPIRVSGDQLHHKGERISVVMEGVSGRHLILLNLAGDGTIQYLYPLERDPPVVREAEYKLELKADDPLGADQIVAISSAQALPRLERELRELDHRRNASKLEELIEKYAQGDVRVGSAGVFTAK